MAEIRCAHFGTLADGREVTAYTLSNRHGCEVVVLDCLRYWSGELGVDGFRFDLATILGRHSHGFSPEHPLLRAISS